MQCPKCNSTEAYTEERVWTWRSNQMLLTCRSCGRQFKLGEDGSVGNELDVVSDRLQDFVVFGVIIFLVSALLKRLWAFLMNWP